MADEFEISLDGALDERFFEECRANGLPRNTSTIKLPRTNCRIAPTAYSQAAKRLETGLKIRG